MKSRNVFLNPILIAIFCYFISIPVSYARKYIYYNIAEDSLKIKKEKTFIKFWYGHNCYKMNSFNEKLRLEGNNEIKGGYNFGFEFANHKLCIKIPMFKEELIFKLPIVGLEYLGANSVTTHTFSNEGSNINSVTVKWVLPVLGVYIAPELNVLKKAIQFNLRPIGLGYYQLGSLFDAKLIVTDRPGAMKATGTALGFISQFGVKYVVKGKDIDYEILSEIGIRTLEFDDITLEPTGGFTETYNGSPVSAGYLPQILDYSGFIIKVGLSFRFK